MLTLVNDLAIVNFGQGNYLIKKILILYSYIDQKFGIPGLRNESRDSIPDRGIEKQIPGFDPGKKIDRDPGIGNPGIKNPN